MPGRRKGEEPELPRGPGWYPDPWSATGDGERYFDGKRWGTSAKPLGRHTTVAIESQSRVRQTRSRLRRNAVPLLFFAGLVGVALFVQHLHHSGSAGGTRVEALVGTPTTAVGATTPTTIGNRPPPSAEAAKPLGVPASPLPTAPGKFETLSDQPDDPHLPVAWDPCRPIHYVVNLAGAPDDALLLTKGAIARVQQATGLHFVYDGASTERPSKDRKRYQPVPYDPARWAPVLIAWSDENEFPDLAGYVDGVGAPDADYMNPDGSRIAYVTGQVVFDRHDLSRAADPDRGDVRAVMLHELGHLVGLGHTPDRQEIMFSEGQFNVRDYGPGDLRGLAELGTQPCYPGT
jgi:hypothetical protein